MEIYLDKVTINEKDILYRLLEYSLFEESASDGNEMNNEGIFEYKYFDKYFVEEDRDAFFVKEKETDKLLGFVMINTYMQKKESGHSIAEFMIIPKYRRNGIGKITAFKCFELYQGAWEVSPSLNSDSAYHFWENVISEYTNKTYEYSDRIFSFTSK